MYRKDFLDTNIVITLHNHFEFRCTLLPFIFILFYENQYLLSRTRFDFCCDQQMLLIALHKILEIPLLEIIPRIYFLLYDCVRRNIEENKKKRRKKKK